MSLQTVDMSGFRYITRSDLNLQTSHENIITMLNEYAEYLMSHMIPCGDSINTFMMLYPGEEEEHFTIKYIDMGLYHGGGVAEFLLAYGYYFKNQKAIQMAKGIIDFFIISYSQEKFTNQFSLDEKYRYGITSVAILVFFDQAIKAALYFPFDELSITLIPGILNIYVILNLYQTLVLQMAGVYASSYLVAFFKMLLLPLFFLLLFIFSRSKSKFNFRTEIGYIGIILVSSAIISTVIDSLIYKGTPDYFYLIQLYSSVDLKDIFAFLGAGCLLSIVSTKGAFKG